MSTDIMDPYDQLLSRYKQLTILRTAIGILYWDLETKMPPRGIEQRSEQLSLLEVMAHREQVDPKVNELLVSIERSDRFDTLNEVQRRNVKLIRKYYDEEAKLPDELVAEISKQAAITVNVWKRAKAAKDYSMFKPDLAKTIELKKKAADILMAVKGTRTPYDALLDSFEPGMTSEKVTEIFNGMKKGLMSVLERIRSSDVRPDMSILKRRVPVEDQRKISLLAMKFVGYDTTSPNAGGRLDETEHPFSTGYYDDLRITTHYHIRKFDSSLFSVLHEAGHAMYEGNQPAEWKYQPVGAPASYGVHESQSRFVENIIGRSPEFLSYVFPKIKKVTGSALSDVKARDFIIAVNNVKPSKIRIEADEVTYGLHIIIRFEIERDIFEGKIGVDELPQVWNEKYGKYLGVKIKNDSEGVMQDTHWANGSFGYFPSYALGNIYGGMFLERMERDLPEWRSSIAKGNFMPVREWLKENVHSKGNLYDPADLVKVITGRSLDIDPFIKYLDGKMGKIFGY
ncbi:MAG: carboxypeptidase M32 [Methanomassiliicoccales archaeon]|nr:MAG: carboxypeptidase M32 [Methanomassiliicoccales archaeon]